MRASGSSTSIRLTLNNLSSPNLPFRPCRPNQPTSFPAAHSASVSQKASSILRVYLSLAQTRRSSRLDLFGSSVVDSCTNKEKLVVQKIEIGVQCTVCVVWPGLEALPTALLHGRRRLNDYLMQRSGSSRVPGTKLLSAEVVVMEVPWQSGTVHTTCSPQI